MKYNMKTYNKLLIAMAAIAMIFTTSCLDDSMVDIEVEDFAGSPYIVDFNEMPNSDGFIRRSLELKSNPADAVGTSFRVNLSSPWQLKEDLTVTVQLDNQAATDFAAGLDGYEVLPSDKISFSETTVVIPAGEREVEFPVDFFTAGIQISDNFVVAFSITGTSNPDVLISGNFGTQYVKIGVKNQFHDVYDVDPYWLYQGSTNYTSLAATEVQFSTTSATACSLPYTYAGWGSWTFDVDLDNPQTIDGHANAYKVTVDFIGYEGENTIAPYDNYEGEVWNYCYKNSEDKWVFRIANGWTPGSSTHVSANVYTQQ